MKRDITLTTGQWSDLSLEDICRTAQHIGYNGLEMNFRKSIVDIERAAISRTYCDEILDTLYKYNLKCYAISSHAIGQCVGDIYDCRLDNFVPEKYRGKPKEIKKWAVNTMLMVPHVLKNMNCKISTSFMGSPIWRYFYSFPQTTKEMVDDGYSQIIELFTPVLDEFDKQGVIFALEIHPTEIAFDYYSTQELLKRFPHNALKINFDPSHLLWQGVNPEVFIRDFAEYIVHVHIKDVKLRKDGKASVLGSHLPFGDYRRGWDFRSVGRGDVDFEEIIRALDDIGYTGPLSVEWEDNGMDRVQGAAESFEYVKKLMIEDSKIQFDSAIKYKSRL